MHERTTLFPAATRLMREEGERKAFQRPERARLTRCRTVSQARVSQSDRSLVCKKKRSDGESDGHGTEIARARRLHSACSASDSCLAAVKEDVGRS